jgi:hypothetical protein
VDLHPYLETVLLVRSIHFCSLLRPLRDQAHISMTDDTIVPMSRLMLTQGGCHREAERKRALTSHIPSSRRFSPEKIDGMQRALSMHVTSELVSVNL